LAAVAAIAGASSAVASPLTGSYVQGTVGADVQASRNDGVAVSIAAGKDFGMVRAEAEYTATRGANSATNGNVASDLLTLNAYIEPVTIYGVTPYVGAGIGYGEFYRAGVVGDRDGMVFNGTVGASYGLTDKLDLVGQYRYTIANDVKVVKTTGVEDYRASTISVGLRYTF